MGRNEEIDIFVTRNNDEDVMVIEVEDPSFLPGLALHPSIGTDDRTLATLTHRKTGAALLSNIHREYLDDIRKALSEGNWLLPAPIVLSNEKNRELLTLARRLNNKDLRQLSKSREQEIAGDLDGRAMPASGSRPGAKRDVHSAGGIDGFLIEHKGSDPEGRSKDAIRVKLKDLEFLRRQAAQRGGATPVYVVEPGFLAGAVVIPNEVIPDTVQTLRVVRAPEETKTFAVTRAIIDELYEWDTRRLVHADGSSEKCAPRKIVLSTSFGNFAVFSYGLFLELFHEGEL